MVKIARKCFVQDWFSSRNTYALHQFALCLNRKVHRKGPNLQVFLAQSKMPIHVLQLCYKGTRSELVTSIQKYMVRLTVA